MILESHVEKKAEGVLEIKTKVSADYISKIMDEITADIHKNVELKGFRKGKAPLSMIQKIYEGKIKYETLNKILPEVYEKIIQEKNIKPSTMPEFSGYENMEKGKDLEFSFTLETMPEIEQMDSYENKEFVKVEIEHNLEELVAKEIEVIKETHATYTNIEGETALNDFIKVSYTDLKSEKKETKSSFFLLRENDPFFSLSKNFIGRKLKEKYEIDATFPSNFFLPELAGKEARLEFVIEEGRRIVYPEINEEFAKKLGYESVDLLKEAIRQSLKQKIKEQEILATADKIYAQIAEKSTFSIAPSIVLQQAQSELTRFINDLRIQGKTIDAYLAENNLDQSGFIEKMKNEALLNIKKYLVMEKIRKDNRIEVKKEDIDQYITQLADNQIVNKENIREYYNKHPQAKEQLEERVKEIKTAEWIVNHVRFNGVEKKK